VLEDEIGEALATFAPDLRAAAIGLLSEMVTSAGTRYVISAEDLYQRVRETEPDITPALLDEALVRLERESKLVRRERRRDVYLYEITSGFLVPWISRQREALRMVQEYPREPRRFHTLVAVLLIVAVLVTALVALILNRCPASTARPQQLDRAHGVAYSAVRTSPGISLAVAPGDIPQPVGRER
jgi:hypothetical protein